MLWLGGACVPVDAKPSPSLTLGSLEALQHVEERQRRGRALDWATSREFVGNLPHIPRTTDLDRRGIAEVCIIVSSGVTSDGFDCVPPSSGLSAILSGCEPICSTVVTRRELRRAAVQLRGLDLDPVKRASSGNPEMQKEGFEKWVMRSRK